MPGPMSLAVRHQVHVARLRAVGLAPVEETGKAIAFGRVEARLRRRTVRRQLIAHRMDLLVELPGGSLARTIGDGDVRRGLFEMTRLRAEPWRERLACFGRPERLRWARRSDALLV